MNWQRFIAEEASIAVCEQCASYAGGTLGAPEPSWVGRDYEPGGVAFVLQNSAVLDARDHDDRGKLYPGPAKREALRAEALDALRGKGGARAYHKLVAMTHAWMQGTDGLGPPTAPGKPWPTWTHPVSKCISGCIEPSRFAWVNVVKYRTADNRTPSAHEWKHGKQHLQHELDMLQPGIVVTIGRKPEEAAVALGRRPVFVKARGASDLECAVVRDLIRAAGLCR